LADNGLTALEAELRAPVPESCRRLSDEQLQDLTAAIRDARHRQTAALAAAGDRALGQLPRILRGPIRKVLR
jgi:hypothetical protein